jgi:hypothetical protein
LSDGLQECDPKVLVPGVWRAAAVRRPHVLKRRNGCSTSTVDLVAQDSLASIRRIRCSGRPRVENGPVAAIAASSGCFDEANGLDSRVRETVPQPAITAREEFLAAATLLHISDRNRSCIRRDSVDSTQNAYVTATPSMPFISIEDEMNVC